MKFLSPANNLHPSIKFTHEISNTTISFLDTSSSLIHCCLAAVILFIWLRAYHSQALRIRRICPTDKSLKKPLGQLKNHLKKKGVINKVVSRKVLAKFIITPGAAYFSTKKNRNVKEPLVSSHNIPVWEKASTPFVSIGHRRKKIQTVQNPSWASHGCLQTIKQSEKHVGADSDF